jgi:hypothetical protein
MLATVATLIFVPSVFALLHASRHEPPAYREYEADREPVHA